MFCRIDLVLGRVALLSGLHGCSGTIYKTDADSGDLREAGNLDTGHVRDSGADAFAFDGPIGVPICTHTPGRTQPFLITFAPKPFPDKPNLMRATIEFVGSDSMVLTTQFFAFDRVTLVGTPVVTERIPLAANGLFRTPPLQLEIPGAADCALPDTAMTVEVTLEGGAICDDTFFACGVVNGFVTGLGVDLNGSTFTAQKIENDVIPPPVLNCEKTGVALACK